MRGYTRVLATVGAFISLALVPINASASPVFRENFRITETDLGMDPCAGFQPVAVTETLHFVLLVNADNAGGFHVNGVVNIENGTGINLVTGATYVAGGANATSFNVKPPFPQVTTNEATAVLVSQGHAPNMLAKTLIHFTVNANGTVTASIFRFEISCKG
jgi:hypothetical protein